MSKLYIPFKTMLLNEKIVEAKEISVASLQKNQIRVAF
jgi:hypothetical protein